MASFLDFVNAQKPASSVRDNLSPTGFLSYVNQQAGAQVAPAQTSATGSSLEASPLESLAVSVGHGIHETGAGLKQFYLEQTDPQAAKAYTAQQKEDEEVYRQTPVANSLIGQIGSAVGNIIATAPTMAVVPAEGVMALTGAKAANAVERVLGVIGNATTQGALIGGLSLQPEGGSRVDSAVTGATVAAGTAGTVMAAAKVLPTLKQVVTTLKKAPQNYQVGKLAAENIEEMANVATQNTLQKVAKGFIDSTPADFLKNLSSYVGSAYEEKEALYAARNALADHEGIQVKRTALSELRDRLQADRASGMTSDQLEKLREAKQALGDGSDVSFEKAHTLLTGLMKQVDEAKAKNEFTRKRALLEVAKALEFDIQRSASPTVLVAQKAAAEYNRDVYAPLRSLQVGKGGDPESEALVDQLAQGKYMKDVFSDIVSDLKKKGDMARGVEKLSPELKQEFVAAHVNALKESSVENGEFNLKLYANQLKQALKKNNPIYENLGALDALNGLGTALDVMRKVEMSGYISPHSAGQAVSGALAAVSVGKPQAALSFGIGHKLQAAYRLYAAGKMLNDKTTRELLTGFNNLPPDSSEELVKNLSQTLSTKFHNITGTFIRNFLSKGMALATTPDVTSSN